MLRYVKYLTVLVTALVVAAVVVATPAGAYQGAGGCPRWIPAYASVPCAWHVGIRRFLVHASDTHSAIIYWRAGGCSGNCTADTGYLPRLFNGRPRIQNNTGQAIYVYGTYLYQ